MLPDWSTVDSQGIDERALRGRPGHPLAGRVLVEGATTPTGGRRKPLVDRPLPYRLDEFYPDEGQQNEEIEL